tara:strand:+ start:1019 stop:1915 length:897 start_codon:yes stop_codon:yes gene_type:complete
MKRTIEISASFTGKISTGSFENESPYFSAKEIIDIDNSNIPEEFEIDVNKLIEVRQAELKNICYGQFKKHAEIAYQEKVAKSYKNIRFYEAGNGQKYPSVTSIINMDANFFTPPDELAQMAARGTIIHKQIEIYLATGKWLEPKEIPEIAFQVMTVVTGSLGLAVDDVNFINFIKDYPFKVLKQESTVINHDHKYGGRMDILCVIESTNKGKWDKIEGIAFDVPTILDIKTGASLDKAKGMIQQAAYAMCEDVKQIGLIHLTKDNQCGYAKPAVSTKIESYWSIFLNKRKLFNERYGV